MTTLLLEYGSRPDGSRATLDLSRDHTALITGPAGSGKTTLARRLAVAAMAEGAQEHYVADGDREATYEAVATVHAELVRRTGTGITRPVVLILDSLDVALDDSHATTVEERRAPWTAREQLADILHRGGRHGIRTIVTMTAREQGMPAVPHWLHLPGASAEGVVPAGWPERARESGAALADQAPCASGTLALHLWRDQLRVATITQPEED